MKFGTATMEVRNAISNDVAVTLTNALLGRYSYDLEMKTGSTIRTYTYGTIEVKKDTTANQ